MRRLLLYALGGLLLLLVAAFVAAWLLVDPAAISAEVERRAESAIGEPVKLGEVGLALFPMPAARVRDVVVGRGPEPLASIDELRVRVSLPALLFGRVVLRAVELDRPVVALELDADGAPRLPGGAARPAPAPEAETGTGSAPALAISKLRVRDGAVRAGPWQATGIELDGGLELDGSARFDLDADVAGAAKLRGVEIELWDLFAETPTWSVHGGLEDAELAPLAARLELAPAPAGRAAGRFAASGRGGELSGAELDLVVDGLELESESLALAGRLPLRAVLGESFRADLGDVAISVPGVLAKPRGGRLSVEGPLGVEPSLAALGPFTARVGTSELRGRVSLEGAAPELILEGSTLDLEPLAPWLAEPRPTRGLVRIESLELVPEPLSVRGAATLEAVELALPRGPLVVSGPVRGEGRRIVASPLDVRVGGEPSTVDATYDLASGAIDVNTELTAVDFEALAGALVEKPPLTGTLAARVNLHGPPALERLAGQGTLELREGRVRGFSLMKAVLGELSTLPLLVARVGKKDLTRYDEEQYEKLAASFRLAKGVANVDDLVIEYKNATAELHGTVGVPDGKLALSGRLVLSEELDAELAGEGAVPRKRVIPIEGVTGTVSQPRVKLDARAVSSALATVAGSDKVRERLEEKLGPGGAEAVEDVLDKLLRGGGGKK